MAQLKNLTKNQIITAKVIEARTFWERSKGLLGRDGIDRDTSMWIHQCPSIHTFFMRFTIDAVFVDHQLKVTSIKDKIPPGRITVPTFGSSSVFEMAAGLAREMNIQVGDQLHVGD
ncbi:MAG: DUF192 domain-containing protein [Bdellovibrionaceae bacterium]|nr:DUF192 domain-containing protein [Bdellovibrionales bacterium]MCB9086392.1 DUF192 domain-containing protein [Pseudobdellovibrionaceae bacterium]